MYFTWIHEADEPPAPLAHARDQFRYMAEAVRANGGHYRSFVFAWCSGAPLTLSLHCTTRDGAEVLFESKQLGGLASPFLASALRAANDAVVITEASNPSGGSPRIIWANDAYSRMTGYSLDELVGRSPSGRQGPRTRAEVKRGIRAAMDAWEPWRVELINYRKSGEAFLVELSAVPVADEGGWFTHWVSFQREASSAPSQRLAEALELLGREDSSTWGRDFLEHFTRTLGETFEVDHVLVSAKTDEGLSQAHCFALWADGEHGEPFAYALEDSACLRVLREGVPLRCFSGAREAFPKNDYIVNMPAECYLGIPITDREGQVIGLVAALARQPLKDPESVECFIRLFIARLSSEIQRERAERRLRHATRMESIGVLAGGIAHDLNNALTPLLALPELLTEELDAALDGDTWAAERVRRDVRDISSSAHRASAVIDDLMALSRLHRVRHRAFDLNDVVSAFVASSGAQVSSRGGGLIEVSWSRQPGPLPLQGHAPHVVRMLSNLVHNACDAMPRGGRVTISTGRCELSGAGGHRGHIPAGSYVTLTVADTGVGVPDDIAREIFEPFFTSKPQTRHSGTGLGLAVVLGLAEEHGGFVDLDPRPGEGAVFTVYFPQLMTDSHDWQRL